MRRRLLICALALGLAAAVTSEAATPPAPGWPRAKTASDGTTVVVYEPQIDAWNSYVELKYRAALEIRPPGSKTPIPAAMQMVGETSTDLAARTVLLYNQKIVRLTFPGTDDATARRLTQVVASVVPSAPMKFSLDEVLAHFEPGQHAKPPEPEDARRLESTPEPPAIVHSSTPAVLVLFDGAPAFAPLEGTGLRFAVNTNWVVLRAEGDSRCYLLEGGSWLRAADPTGPWEPADTVPRRFWNLPKTDAWAEARKSLPGTAITRARMPRVFVSVRPAELILFEGAPKLAAIPGTGLGWATNTDSDLFQDRRDGAYYFLTSGRWFRGAGLDGPWTYAGNDLPADFGRIPKDHPRARVRVSVPGTPEAEEAVLLARVPHQAEVKRDEVTVNVAYGGSPEFERVPGTSVSYATNTAYDVIRVEDRYYACHQAVWFVAVSPSGPWVVADFVPAVIYTIPPSCPKYHVTYVRVYASSASVVVFGYTSGYMGVYVSSGCVVFGTGYYYRPYCYVPPRAFYPVYYPAPYTYGVKATYNPYTGVYARTAVAYGPYGGIGYGAAYNPTTGTYARGVAVAGPYQAGFAGQAYNPRTGTYAATYQRSNPYQSWGRSVVTRGDEWARGAHYSDARGTVAGVETSKGGKAVGVRTAEGATTFAKSGQTNNVYASHDGNVYRNTGGGWQTYEDGAWKPVEKPEPGAGTGKGLGAKVQPGTGAERGGRTGSSEWSNNEAQLERDRQARQSAEQRQSRTGAGSRESTGRSRGSDGGGRRR